MSIIIGFTATRNGLTDAQKTKVREILSAHKDWIGEHGDCVGGDADCHAICRELGAIDVYCRPCTISNMRAHTDAKVIAEPERPMQRNRAIVADAKLMIACPWNYEPIKQGSGTWATIGFTQKAGKKLYIVYPDGTTQGVSQ